MGCHEQRTTLASLVSISNLNLSLLDPRLTLEPMCSDSMSAMEQSQAYFNGGMPGLPPGAGVAPFGAGAAYVPGMPPELASLVAAGRIEPLARSSMVHGNSRGLDDGVRPYC